MHGSIPLSLAPLLAADGPLTGSAAAEERLTRFATHTDTAGESSLFEQVPGKR